MRIVIDWAHQQSFPVRVYYRGRAGRVVIMNGLGDNIRLLHLLKPTDQVICFTVGDYAGEAYQMMRRLLGVFGLAPERLSVLCNDEDQLAAAKSSGLTAYYVNKNAFIDERAYRPRLMEKRFDAVSNARLVKLKRVPLARLVENLAIIRGHQLETTEYDDPAAIPHSYLNSAPLSPRGVVNVLSASRVGLALSAAEGACQASSEYLLCGLPVVSTPSRGGRDVWYDAHNSIICEPVAEAVRDAVQHQIERLQRGEIEPQAIRQRHLVIAQEHRERFLQILERAFDDIDATHDPRVHFAQNLDSSSIVPRYQDFASIAQELSND